MKNNLMICFPLFSGVSSWPSGDLYPVLVSTNTETASSPNAATNRPLIDKFESASIAHTKATFKISKTVLTERSSIGTNVRQKFGKSMLFKLAVNVRPSIHVNRGDDTKYELNEYEVRRYDNTNTQIHETFSSSSGSESLQMENHGDEHKVGIFSSHIRHKRATNDTEAATGFLDDPNKVAMFIVLPVIIFVYGGCICIYCVHKCQDYVERMEPLKVIKRKVFGVPAENPAIKHLKRLFMRRPRPTSAKSMPDPERQDQKEFDTRSVKSDAGISYYRDTTKDSMFSDMDIDSGVHSDGNDKGVFAGSPEVKQTSEMAVQTEDIHIMTISTSDAATCTNYHLHGSEQPKHKKPRMRHYANVGSRYLSWLKSARELRQVLTNNTEPRTLHDMLRIATEERDLEENKNNEQKLKRKKSELENKESETGTPMAPTDTNQDSSYISIHKKKAHLLKLQDSFIKGATNSVAPVETRLSSASLSSRGTDSPMDDKTQSKFRPKIKMVEAKSDSSYVGMHKRKPNIAKGWGMGDNSPVAATKSVGISSSTDMEDTPL